jgi:chromate transporter
MSSAPARVSFRDALRVWARIGLLGFGGPAGQIALMHRELVERRRWIDETRFLHALNYCMLLPGPEAQQLATYVGWLMHGTRGGIAAGTLFVLPGSLLVLALSATYAAYHRLPAVEAIFYGLKAAVLAIVIEALIRIGKRALVSRPLIAIAALAFVAIAIFDVPFPLIVIASGITGAVLSRAAPETLVAREPAFPVERGETTLIDAMAARGELAHTLPSRARALRVLVIGVCLWAAPVALLLAGVGPPVLADIAIFFSETAVTTFGGAYAVLAWVGQRAVESFGWLAPNEMLDGLGLAETTPGPLILVTEFVGFLAAYRDPGGLPPWLAGTLGAAITLWVTFVPCFLWIFLGAPWMESARRSAALRGALTAITASVVGVILDLTLWFSMHVLFARSDEVTIGPLELSLPDPRSVDPVALAISIAAMIAMLRLRIGIGWTLAGAVLAGVIARATLGLL